MAERYHFGDRPTLTGEVRDKETNELTDPEKLTLQIELPAGAFVTYVWPTPDEEEDELELTRTAEGQFEADYLIATEGGHSLNWLAEGDVAESEPGQFFAYPKFLRYLRPSHAHVAAVRASRTYVDGADLPVGTKAKAFTDDTDPTADDVDNLIDEAIDDVRAVFSANEIPRASWEPARRAIVCKVALAIELTDLHEDTVTSSPFLQLRRDVDNAMKALREAAQVRDLFGVE